MEKLWRILIGILTTLSVDVAGNDCGVTDNLDKTIRKTMGILNWILRSRLRSRLLLIGEEVETKDGDVYTVEDVCVLSGGEILYCVVGEDEEHYMIEENELKIL